MSVGDATLEASRTARPLRGGQLNSPLPHRYTYPSPGVPCHTLMPASAAASSKRDAEPTNWRMLGQRAGRRGGIRHQLLNWEKIHQQETEDAEDARLRPSSQVNKEHDLENIIQKLTASGAVHWTNLHALADSAENTELETQLDTADDTEVDIRAAVAGALVLLTSNNKVQMGVIVRALNRARAWIFTLEGTTKLCYTNQIQLYFPNFVTADELEPLLPHAPINVGAIENLLEDRSTYLQKRIFDAGSTIHEKLIRLEQEADRVYRNNSAAFDDKLEILCEERHSYRLELRDAARKILKLKDDVEPTKAQLIATYKSWAADGVISNIEIRRSNAARVILSRRDNEIVKLVEGWWHDYLEAQIQERSPSSRRSLAKQPLKRGSSSSESSSKVLRGSQIIAAFIQHAREIITRHRRTRPFLPEQRILGSSTIQFATSSQGGDLKPTRAVTEGTFDLNEMVILRFMELWGARGRITPTLTQATIASSILKEVGCYTGITVSRIIGELFLKEIGIITPWSSEICFRLSLPGFGSDMTTDQDLQRAEQSIETPQNDQFIDSLKEHRVDWGDLDVFCIDGPGTQEHDDGISMEHASDGHDSVWLHVHVANPGAFLDPSHPISRFARRVGGTNYSISSVYRMLPPKFSKHYGSLRKDAVCLTFSTLLNGQGDIIDTKVAPGILRKVHHLTYDTLDEILTGKPFQPKSSISYVVGHNPRLAPVFSLPHRFKSKQDFTSGQIAQLQELGRCLQTRSVRRTPEHVKWQTGFRSKTSLNVSRNRVSVDCCDKPTAINRTSIRNIEGDPTITLTVRNDQANEKEMGDSGESPASQLVEEAMVTANALAAEWCNQRKLPIPYIKTEEDPTLPRRALFFEQVIKPFIDRGEPIPLDVLSEYKRTETASRFNIFPGANLELGLKMYTRATSPLRRYEDLLVNWQISSALKRETMLTPSPAKLLATSSLPMTRTAMLTEMDHLYHARAVSILAGWTDAQWWALQFMARAHYLGECKLPELLTAQVQPINIAKQARSLGIPGQHYGAVLRELDLPSILVVDDSIEHIRTIATGANEVRDGDIWEVEIQQIRLYEVPRGLYIRPVKLLSRWVGS